MKRLRAVDVPAAFEGVDAEVLVTGETAESVDYFALVHRWLPIVFAFVLGLSFVLLMIAFRSIVVPAKAVVLNLLSVGAAYGLLVLVFQKGIGNELFGFQQVDTIEAWVPLFLFSVLFGLSMDYHVFLLSRIRERFTETGANEEAVAYGVGSTARLITGAALIMVAVFAGFARRRSGHVPADGLRRGRLAAHRRDDRPLGAGAGGDDAARHAQLVPAAVARMAAAAASRGSTIMKDGGPLSRPSDLRY